MLFDIETNAGYIRSMAKTNRFVVLLDDQEKREYVRVAKLAGLNLSAWIRATMRMEAAKVCRAMKADDPRWEAFEDAPVDWDKILAEVGKI